MVNSVLRICCNKDYFQEADVYANGAMQMELLIATILHYGEVLLVLKCTVHSAAIEVPPTCSADRNFNRLHSLETSGILNNYIKFLRRIIKLAKLPE